MWQRPHQSLGTNSLLVQKTARLCVLTSASQGSVSPADRPSVCPISHDGWSACNHQMSSSSTAVLVVPPWQQPQPRLTDGPLKRQCTWFLFSICGFSVWRYCTFTNPMNTSIKAWSHQHPLHLVKQIWEVQDFPDHVFTFYERHLGRCPLDVCVCVCVCVCESQSIGLQSECTVALSSPRCPRPAAPQTVLAAPACLSPQRPGPSATYPQRPHLSPENGSPLLGPCRGRGPPRPSHTPTAKLARLHHWHSS